jgi:hypothetical protein
MNQAEVLAKHVRMVLPTQERFERAYGRGQWPAYTRRTVYSNDVLKGFMNDPHVAGDTAWVKPALAKARESKDLVRIVEKLEKQIEESVA